MYSFLRIPLGLSYAVLISISILTQVARAEEGVSNTADKNTDRLKEINQYVQQTRDLAPATSVSQLSDVQPSDWSFQALQSLVERYGCITGYPDGSFKGNQSMTRFEFAVALSTCLNRVNQQIAADTSDTLVKEDLATLQKLQEEFTTELITLRGRVDALEPRIAKLEKQQPSTNIKLKGQLIFAATDTFGDASSNRNSNNLAFSTRLRVNLKTSFTGKDELLARVQASSVINPSGPGNDTRLSFQSGKDATNDAFISKLQYTFPLNDRVKIRVATGFNTYFDDWDVINPLQSDADATISRFGRYNAIYRLGGDTGFGATVKLNENIKAEVAYLAKNTNNPTSGLFNGSYGALGQVVYYPNGIPTNQDSETKVTKIAFTYVNAYNEDGLGHNTGSLASNLGGRKVSSNSYGIEGNFAIAEGFQLGGWVGYTNARALTGDVRGDADIWNWAVTLAFPDLGQKGNLGGIVVGMQPKLTSTSAPLSGLPRRDPDTGFHIEGFYRYKINDNISITPGVVWLTAPNHDDRNGDIFLGVVRTTVYF